MTSAHNDARNDEGYHHTVMQPLQTAVIPCPLCHAPLRSTSDYCTSCGAERHFGPRKIELISGMIGGCAVITTASLLLFPLSLWTVLFALVGIFIGFFYAHVRFGVDRWLKGEGKIKQ